MGAGRVRGVGAVPDERLSAGQRGALWQRGCVCGSACIRGVSVLSIASLLMQSRQRLRRGLLRRQSIVDDRVW